MSLYIDYGYQNSELEHTFHYLWNPLFTILQPLKGNTILDVGCGNGAIAIELIKNGFNVYGVDGSAQGIEIANKKHPHRFYVQDFDSDNLPAELHKIPIQTLICIEVIEHLYNPQQFIDFCSGVFDKSTTQKNLIITTPYHGYLKNLLLSIFNKWDTHANPLWQGGHIKLWSKNTITKLLVNNGYEIVKFEGCGRFPYFWKSMLIHAKLIKNEHTV